MSHAHGAVKFSDGSIFFCEYNGTVDVMHQPFYLTSEETQLNWRMPYPFKKCPHVPEDIEIMTTYGRGFHWKGKGCRVCMIITDGQYPNDGENGQYSIDGYPDWMPNELRF